MRLRVTGVAESAKTYLVTVRGIEPGRLVNVQKKSGRPIIKLYIVPSGAVPPAE